MTAAEAYGGARLCLECARHASSLEERMEWLVKACIWRDIARIRRKPRGWGAP